jgi:hypothetical protein
LPPSTPFMLHKTTFILKGAPGIFMKAGASVPSGALLTSSLAGWVVGRQAQETKSRHKTSGAICKASRQEDGSVRLQHSTIQCDEMRHFPYGEIEVDPVGYYGSLFLTAPDIAAELPRCPAAQQSSPQSAPALSPGHTLGHSGPWQISCSAHRAGWLSLPP